MTNNPFDPAEYFKAFDPEAMRKMFDPKNLMAGFQQSAGNFDMSGMMEQNKKQLEEMAEVNKAAAESLQDMMAKQMAIFQEVIAPAQAVIAAESDPEKVKEQTEKFNQTIAVGLGLMKTMAENVRKANEDALATFKTKLDQAMKIPKS